MAGAVGIVFGLCVLSFTLGAALMYVLVRRREEAAQDNAAPSEAPAEPKWAGRTWVDKPMAVEPVDADYETRPIHRNAVVGLPHLEPALATLAEPVAHRGADRSAVRSAGPAARLVVEPAEPLAPQAAVDLAAELAVDPAAELVAEPAAEETAGEPVPQFAQDPAAQQPVTQPAHESAAHVPATQPAQQPAQEPAEPPEPPATRTTLPPPATPQPAEHTTWVEREDFRQRYLRTFEEVRRRAGSN
ncbi:hypothetical protein [Lentzea albida]|uniref:Uncharacterized protein n=1 Tax=Lentzea albida TaxID=65499 RepID=A0A1H9WL32_9PSEU|nr:hypothetical protein [Lentzea albida]SES34626.1 hypothetical protein SAMN04488000_12331 [Lentzea albida]